MNTTIRMTVVKDNLESYSQEVRNQLSIVVRKSALDVEAQAKVNAPVDLGALRASIYAVTSKENHGPTASSEAQSKNPGVSLFPTYTSQGAEGGIGVDEVHALVLVGVDYGPYQEFGTSKMAPHPYLTPAVEAVRPSFEGAIRQVFDKAGPGVK